MKNSIISADNNNQSISLLTPIDKPQMAFIVSH